MADDLYSDEGMEPNKPTAELDKAEAEGEQREEGQEDQGQQTALIPKSLCPDMKVGDEMVVKIVGGHENDWEVEYAPEKHGEDEAESVSQSNSDYD